MGAADGAEFLGVLAAARERFSDAAPLLAAADAARTRLHYLTPSFTAGRQAASMARHVFGNDGFVHARGQGQALTLEDAVACATRRGGGRKHPTAGWASLTPAERQVAQLVGQGLHNQAIAQRLFIALGTVTAHIFTKLGITTRAELGRTGSHPDLTAGGSALPAGPRSARGPQPILVSTCAPPAANTRPVPAPSTQPHGGSRRPDTSPWPCQNAVARLPARRPDPDNLHTATREIGTVARRS